MEMIEFTRNGKREVAFVLGNVAMWAEINALGRLVNCEKQVSKLKDVKGIRK